MASNWTEEDLKAFEARKTRKKAEPKTPEKPTSKQKLQALGRLKEGEMNKTEARFHDEWIRPRVLAGEIVWHAFEAITLKLAPDCRLTVDFFVMTNTGALQAIDVKGGSAVIQDDAMVKMRLAADKFPWPFALVMPNKKADGGGWEFRWLR